MFDLVSDLHIDQWDRKMEIKYPCGVVKHYPYFPKNPQNKLLVVAGDVSDSLENTITYLNDISKYYQKILFVDGNHEHVNRYPELYSQQEINEQIKKLNNDKIIYLSNQPFQHNNTLFVGMCGWWDYNNDNEESINNNLNYFDNWISHLGKNDTRLFINNVIERAHQEYQQLVKLIADANNNDEIKNIIIVSHCVPKEIYCIKDSIDTQYNSHISELLNDNILTSKISHWLFGHIHHNVMDMANNIKFIAHPRGRPEDFNRILYDSIEIKCKSKI